MKIFGTAFLALALAVAAPAGAAAAAREITVFGAASLTDALQAIAVPFEKQSGVQVLFNFAGSNTLAIQIEQGAPADIYFSANLRQMKELEKRNLVERSSVKNLLSNQLVIVVPDDRRVGIRKPSDLLSNRYRRLALADPTAVPAGVYARQYLEKLGLWQRLKGRVVPTLDVRGALAAVASGNVDAGFVYRTDAAISRRVRIAYAVPLAVGPRIVYPVGLVRQGSNPAAAARFLKFLEGSEASGMFRHYGFLTLH